MLRNLANVESTLPRLVGSGATGQVSGVLTLFTADMDVISNVARILRWVGRCQPMLSVIASRCRLQLSTEAVGYSCRLKLSATAVGCCRLQLSTEAVGYSCRP